MSYDVDRDKFVSPRDLLFVIVYLNEFGSNPVEREITFELQQPQAMFAPLMNTASSGVSGTANDDGDDRLSPAPDETLLSPDFTGSPSPEALHESRLWGEESRKWTDVGFEEVLAELAGELADL